MPVGVHNTEVSVNVLIAEFHCSKRNISFNYVLEESFKSLSESPLTRGSTLWFVLGSLELISGSLSSREHAIALGLLSAALPGHSSTQRKLINTTDESREGIKDEKRSGEKEKMAFPEVRSTLSRLVWVVCLAIFFCSEEEAWYLLARKADSGGIMCLERED